MSVFNSVLFVATLVVAMLAPAAKANPDNVMFTKNAPVIDGVANDAAWKEGDWHEMTSLMWGTAPEPSDFSGLSLIHI